METMMISVYIASGPPGSGKSFQVDAFARVMHSEEEIGTIVSADHHWSEGLRGMDGICFSELDSVLYVEGMKQYNFDIKQLSVAHQACMMSFINALQRAVDGGKKTSIIVDNTNIKSYEIAPYYLVGEAFGAEVEILRVETPLDVCIARQTHGVPTEIIEKMHEDFSEVGLHPWTGEPDHPTQHMPWWKTRSL